MRGEKTKLLWQNPEYREHMSKAHLGNKKAKGAYSFEKGDKNKAKLPEVRKKITESRIGKKNPNWKGGEYLSSGYKKVLKDVKCYILEHRTIMSEYMGRELDEKEVVHHIDGDKANNNINNLMLLSSIGEHTSLHHRLRKEGTK